MEVRGLLRRLGASGRTVLVSSHLLAEIQAACDHLVVIRPGELVYAGPTADLLARGAARVAVRPEHDEDTDALAGALRTAGWGVEPHDGALHVTGDPDPADVNRAAAASGIVLRELLATRDSLEDVFLALTADGALTQASR